MSKKINLKDIEISFDETYHLYKGKPLYKKRFKKVMSFHEPGIAAVYDDTGAYHIDINGKPIYEDRYKKTYGFYEGIATVANDYGYFHIDAKGKKIHKNRFEWAGNFQEGRCVVRDFNGNYFHIKTDGERAYKENYKYAGDFKYGIAVVYLEDGYATHIDKNGKFIHNKKFVELDVYHKGYAIARDEFGYFHIDKNGNPLYKERYEWVEPFYNDYSLVRDFTGKMKIIDEKGNTIKVIISYDAEVNIKRNFRAISNRLVGYWQTQILYSIAKLGILDLLKNNELTKEEIKQILKLPNVSINLVLDYLLVYGFIEFISDKYRLTSIGKLFIEKLKYPALMWGEEHYIAMSKLYDALQTGEEQFSKIYGDNFFYYINKDENKEKLKIYQKSMEVYSLDYDKVVKELTLSKDIKVIADIGGGNISLLSKILNKFQHIEKAYLFDLPNTIEKLKKDFKINNKIEFIGGDFFRSIPLKNIDAVIMSRVLHDWDDEKANIILKNVSKVLKTQGKLYILETIVPEKPNYDVGISLSFNLLNMVGGRERKLSEFRKLLINNNLIIEDVKNIGLISIIKAIKSY